ncbi:hypothetical protein [Aliarcobacter butzleri]|uniref:hypothetical protein n=1 Tax=Aliarcobacter butzleri TaxID=28197 RepID=UPI0021B22D95|nr:hypothetical protein [Aliarcobacter butzleri]MCT7646835.1 hypothetical protein [Aliarcobacter butzleri]
MAKYKRTKDNRNTILSWILLAIVITVGIFLIGIYLKFTMNKSEIDKVTLCEKNASYGKHIILLDITDKYNFIQINDIKINIENIIKNLGKGKQVKVYFLNDKVTQDDLPVINICNPGNGDANSYIYSNPRLLEKQWTEKFYKPLSNTLNIIEKENVFSYSPIIEMIQWINVNEFKNFESTDNKLTIISDMIQNSPEYSFLKNKINDFDNSDFYLKYKTNMQNFTVQILLTRRDKMNKYQNNEYLDFWLKYFELQNAIVNTIKRIDG